jgi:anhydro-N-acetylmuramic acid kinase
MDEYNIIGLMSGTSLDGIDICYANYLYKKDKWNFNIINAITVNLPKDLKTALSNATTFSALEMAFLNNNLGDFFGEAVNEFIINHNIDKSEIDFISSHGHTIFHQPEKKLTLQIGNGANISAINQLPVICDFRTTDLSLNGNGAPLVPIGDQLLFSEYDYCINLGGISNISYQENKNRIAFDICPVNIVLNKLANKLGFDYDKDGALAKSGNFNKKLFTQLNQLEYYKTSPPKSLGYEWVENHIFPLIDKSNLLAHDILNTFVEHIAFQVGNHLTKKGEALFTGGGTLNTYLIERINHYSTTQIIIPSKKIINFKEALIFGFLGVLRWRNEINIISSVTGATKNNIGGCIYNALPK